MSTADGPIPAYQAKPHPRIAMVVFNQMHYDTRVIREAQAAMAAGATVRVFAFGGRYAGRYPVGLAEVDGVEVDRLPVLTLVALAGPILGLLGRLRKRRGTASVEQSAEAATATPANAPEFVMPSVPRPLAWAVREAMRFDKVLRQCAFWFRGVRAVRAWRPDLIHAHDANTLMVVGCAARSLKVPFVYDSHELWTQRNIATSRPIASRLEGPMERYWIRRAAGVITVSDSIAHWLQDKYGLTTTPSLVRNIPPLTGSMPPRSAGRLRELAGLGPDTSVIVYCGSITTNRGIERGIEALPFLADNIHLVMLGPGSAPQLKELDALAHHLNVAARVHPVGIVPSEQVSGAMADADVSLVLTRPVVLSYAFSLPNKLFESLHAGIPVLVSDTPDAAALVREYGLGEVLKNDAAPEEAAAIISRMMANAGDYRGNAEKAAQDLNWQRELRKLLATHEAALGG